MKKGIFIIVSYILLSATCLGQNTVPEDKIDLFFRLLITQRKQNDSAAQKKSASCSIKKTTLRPDKNVLIEKRYECIVYTKNAKALRDKNIIINSELPSFVTAVATLRQIEQMSLMREVIYIEAPKTDLLH